MRATATAVTVVVVVALGGCVRNPVGSARNAGVYASKASMSAESALSAVSTVQMVAEAASDDRLFRPFASVAVGQQEDAITEVAQTFRSIQPPDVDSSALRDELGPLLDAARRPRRRRAHRRCARGTSPTRPTSPRRWRPTPRQLEAFAEAHE